MEPSFKRGKVTEDADESLHPSAQQLDQGALYPLFNALCENTEPSQRSKRLKELRILFVYAFFLAHRQQFVNRFAAEAFLDRRDNSDADALLYQLGDSGKLCARIPILLSSAYVQPPFDMPKEILLQEIVRRLPMASALALRTTHRHLLWNVEDKASLAWRYYFPVIKALGWDSIGKEEFIRRVREMPEIRTVLFYIACLWTTEWSRWRFGKYCATPDADWDDDDSFKPVGPENTPLAETLVVPPVLDATKLAPYSAHILRRRGNNTGYLPETTQLPMPTPATLEFMERLKPQFTDKRSELIEQLPGDLLRMNPGDVSFAPFTWGPGWLEEDMLHVYQTHFPKSTNVYTVFNNGQAGLTEFKPETTKLLLVPYNWFEVADVLNHMMGPGHPSMLLVLLTLIPETVRSMVIQDLPTSQGAVYCVKAIHNPVQYFEDIPIKAWDVQTAYALLFLCKPDSGHRITVMDAGWKDHKRFYWRDIPDLSPNSLQQQLWHFVKDVKNNTFATTIKIQGRHRRGTAQLKWWPYRKMLIVKEVSLGQASVAEDRGEFTLACRQLLRLHHDVVECVRMESVQTEGYANYLDSMGWDVPEPFEIGANADLYINLYPA